MHPDHREYMGVTRPARIEKALLTLQGLLAGVGVDGLDLGSRQLLLAWADDHRDVERSHPFSNILPCLRRAIADGVLDEEEHAELSWMCTAWMPESTRFRPGTSEMQELHGLLGGIAADGRITDAESDLLVEWLDGHQHVSDIWPYQDVARMLTEALRDGIIDDREREELVSFFAEFTRTADHRVISQRAVASAVGPCAIDPQVKFKGRSFVFTGASAHGTRKELEAIIRRMGGGIGNVHDDLDYLVVGANGNPTWAYSCLGRKLEDVMARVAAGRASTVIVFEPDFWRAVAEHGGDVPEPRLGNGRPATDLPTRPPVPAGPDVSDIAVLLAGFAAEKRGQGWHVELDTTRCTLHRLFKNGKPRKAIASLVYVDSRVDENGQEIPLTDRSRPWLVRATRSWRSFKDVRKAADVFIVETAELALEA